MADEKKKNSTKSWEYYDSSNGLKRKRKTCPKCGPGFFLADHSNRVTCGKCSYAEFKGSSSDKKE
jgi:small subunit ribosomal protein S27Ae